MKQVFVATNSPCLLVRVVEVRILGFNACIDNCNRGIKYYRYFRVFLENILHELILSLSSCLPRKNWRQLSVVNIFPKTAWFLAYSRTERRIFIETKRLSTRGIIFGLHYADWITETLIIGSTKFYLNRLNMDGKRLFKTISKFWLAIRIRKHWLYLLNKQKLVTEVFWSLVNINRFSTKDRKAQVIPRETVTSV